MTRSRLLLMPALALMVACSGNTGTNGEAKKVSKKDMQGFTSADRAYADVRGDAQHCITLLQDMDLIGDSLVPSDEAMESIINQTFDANGYITSVVREDMYMHQPVGKSVFTFDFDSNGGLNSSSTDLDGRLNVSRDKNGYVQTFVSINNTGDTDYKKKYKWKGDRLASEEIVNDYATTDADGNPRSIPIDKVTYTYDKDGYLLSSHEESGDRKHQYTIIDTSYRNMGYDSIGNWTQRDVKHVAKVYNRQDQVTDSVVTFQSETREITYMNNK